MSVVAANYFSQHDANYRRFELPWTRVAEESKRQRKTLTIVMGVLLVLSVIIPFLPVRDIDRNAVPDLPPRLAKIMLEKKIPPPPPPVKPETVVPELPKVAETPTPKPEPKPKAIAKPKILPPPVVIPKVVETPQPRTAPVEQSREKAREKAKSVGLLAVADDLASLRRNDAVASTSGRSLSAAVETGKRTERALITSKSGKRSAGVNTAALSRNTGGGGLAGRASTAIVSPVAQTSAPASRSAASSGQGAGSNAYAGQRSQEEIETIFDRNKAAIYALYRRALRKDPTLQGKLVLQVTIAPSGAVTACNVVSSELSSPDFESSLIKRVKLFKFGAQDVDEITTTKPIDFFPA